ncbi:MAG: phosphosulfolactate synthase [Dethiobacteria bacterium]
MEKLKKIHNGWELDLCFPWHYKIEKPRSEGITMILDKGMGLRETLDLLEMSSRYIDFWKFSFGSSALYSPKMLQRKIGMIKSFHVDVYPGGTFLEIAFVQGKIYKYLHRAYELGFSAVEVSDGTIELTPAQRSSIIKLARSMGLQVLTEIGKKEEGESFNPDLMGEQISKDLDDGAYKVILEARESGKGVTIFDEKGDIEDEKMRQFLHRIQGEQHIIWEAPLKKQQVYFLSVFGPKVNLGNIMPGEVLALQSLRNGLRADTFKLALEGNN